MNEENLGFLIQTKKAKICPKCRLIKSITQFFKDKQQASGIYPYCKICTYNKRKQYAW